VKTKIRFQDVNKLTKPQLELLRVLGAGPARVSNKNVAEPESARRVSSAAWSFIYGDLRRFDLLTPAERRVIDRRYIEWWVGLTDFGREYLAWLDARESKDENG
jgi:hypothetical protein